MTFFKSSSRSSFFMEHDLFRKRVPTFGIMPLKTENFPRIHNVERIERPLDGAHGIERRRAVLGGKIFHFALPDAVFAGAGPAHPQRPLDQALEEFFDARDLGF